MDNILIYTSGLLQDYKVRIYIILAKLGEIKLILIINKYQFEKRSIKYFKFIIKAGVGL